MNDLFYREQEIYNIAIKRLNEIKNGAECDKSDYEAIVKEYGKILKQLRRITKLSDKTAVDLNASKLDLLDKVNYDALTGIFNRRFLEENLRMLYKSMSRIGNSPLSVLMIDIDFFKLYNDTYGHGKGDECLKAVSSAIKACIMRANDFAARYGGEEFAVVLPNTDEKGARIMSRRILEKVRECNMPHEKSEVADCVTVSIGAATGFVDISHAGNEHLLKADEALYESKRNGRNQYTFISLE